MTKANTRRYKKSTPDEARIYPQQPTAAAIADFAKRLGFSFQEPSLMVEALTHRSYINEHSRRQPDLAHYERLEFLGDAVLEFIAGAWLFHRFPELSEGQLSLMRTRLVGTDSLAQFTLNLGAEKLLRLGNGEEAIGARYSLRILSNLFEAILGAIYLDQGLEAARQFALVQLEPALETLLQGSSTKDPKSRLQEWSQGQAQNITPTYHVLQATGPDHARDFIVEVRLNEDAVGWGNGKTIRHAAHTAAEWAMHWLGVE